MPLPLLIPLLLSAGQTVAGLIKDSKAKKDQQSALAKREAYKTPKELIEVVNAAKSRAQDGYDPTTLSYLTNKTDQAFDSSLDVLQRNGGDANSAAGLFDQKMQQMFKIGSENALLNMQNFSKFLSAETMLAQSRDAEWASKQGMVKDELQAAQMNRNAATAQIQNGISTGIATLANYETGKLYQQQQQKNQDTSVPNYVAAPDLSLQPNTNSSSVRSTGASIGRSVIGYDPITGKPIYG